MITFVLQGYDGDISKIGMYNSEPIMCLIVKSVKMASKKRSLCKQFHRLIWLQILILLIINGVGAFAQQEGTFLIRGRVVDATDGNPVDRANVFIENHSHIGTPTDSQGYFLLRIPGFILDDEIVVSALGFTTREIPIESLRSGDDIVVEMTRMSILLDDVVVTPKTYDLERICREAVQRIPKNYPKNTHYISGFYRKVSTDSTQYTGLVEAVIGIRDPGYSSDNKNVQIQVIKARSGDNNLAIDPRSVNAANKIAEQYGVSSVKSLHRFYESNLIRLYDKPFTFFNTQGMAFAFSNDDHINEKAELQNITIAQGDTVLHIMVTTTTAGMQADKVNLSINLSDMAIVEFSRGIFEDKVTVNFTRNKDGRYYPCKIRLVTPILFASSGSKYFDIETFEVDRIETASNKVPKIKQGLDRMDRFDPENYSYVAAFWIQYAIDHPSYFHLDVDIIRSLERSSPLEDQFRAKALKPE